jgi:hypothetical protein
MQETLTGYVFSFRLQLINTEYMSSQPSCRSIFSRSVWIEDAPIMKIPDSICFSNNPRRSGYFHIFAFSQSRHWVDSCHETKQVLNGVHTLT